MIIYSKGVSYTRHHNMTGAAINMVLVNPELFFNGVRNIILKGFFVDEFEYLILRTCFLSLVVNV